MANCRGPIGERRHGFDDACFRLTPPACKLKGESQPEPAEQAKIIAIIRQKALAYNNNPPNFICTISITQERAKVGSRRVSFAIQGSRMRETVSGIEQGQRQLNGPQTSGREYRNLSEPQYDKTIRDEDVAAPMRDCVSLLVDVYRPAAPGRYPVLIAASPYPRQQLEAVSTARDTAWIVLLQDVDAAGTVIDVTAGYMRAGLREVDEANSRIGVPEVPCRTVQIIPMGELVRYRMPLVANARRFKPGHFLRLFITNDDQNPDSPAMLGFRHASVGTSCLNTIRELVAPDLAGFDTVGLSQFIRC